MATTVAESTTATQPLPRSRSRIPLPDKLKRGGWYRAALFDVLGLGFAVGITALLRFVNHQHPVIDGARDHDRGPVLGADLLPVGPGRLRLLALLGLGAPYAPGNARRPRRA